MQPEWIKKSETIYACPVCNSEIEVEQGEEMPGYCKKCETEFEEINISEKAFKFVVEEIQRLEYAPKLNGCEMTPEWAEQLEIFEHLAKLLRGGESNDRCRD